MRETLIQDHTLKLREVGGVGLERTYFCASNGKLALDFSGTQSNDY